MVSDVERCPRCGCREDAVAFARHVPPDRVRELSQMLEVVRRELGIVSDGEAIVEAVVRLARTLNQA